MVDLEAMRTGLKGLPEEEIPRVGDVLRCGWFFFVPLVVVITLLFMGYSANYGAFYGTVSTLALSWLRKDTRMGPKKIFHGLIAGGHNNTSAGAAIGSLGLIIGGVILAGLGLKFSAVLVEFAGGQLFLTVVLVTIISIVIGMGSSTTGSYIILAVVAAPALIHLGVDQVAAHLVVFYAACLSNVTPPVCVSAFAGAAIAGADPMKTGFAALKFGATLVLIPFSLPELLLIGEPAEIAYAALRYLTGYAVLAMGIQKTEFLTGEISQLRRVGFIAAAIGLLFPLLPYIEIAGFALAAVVWAPSLRSFLAARRASRTGAA
jgi:TRAP transporter 4TM/12TM fusion protein